MPRTFWSVAHWWCLWWCSSISHNGDDYDNDDDD